jgi:alanyl-tRNA synthetase
MALEPREYEEAFPPRLGFHRRVCVSCGDAFWTRGDRDRCSEAPCTPYSFQGNSPFGRTFTLDEFREFYLDFFEARGHRRIRRYPVVPRWRNDVMFVQASIYDFQPWVTSGAIDPPANPLTLSQPCLRFNDLDHVGVTGRHLTFFEMLAHHAFNRPESPVYFKDRTVELCHELLVGALGAPEGEITYKEEAWEGGGNRGPSVSVGLRGLELATLVFMEYEGREGAWRPMPMTVVDTGYGLERFVWMSQGTETIYEAIFPRLLPELPSSFSLAEKAVLLDHAKNFLFLFTDGVVPSNVREGYLARLLLRRMLRVLQKHPQETALPAVVRRVAEDVGRHFPEVLLDRAGLEEILELEERRFDEALARGRQQVRRVKERRKSEGRGILLEDLLELYDSFGIPPDAVEEELGTPLQVPSDFLAEVSRRHEKVEPEGAPGEASVEAELPHPPSTLPSTEVLYPLDPYRLRFSARVLYVHGPWVLLDRTYFYPTGGGQVTDQGTLGGRFVPEVARIGGHVLHRLEGGHPPFPPGTVVEGVVDGVRRRQLMQHHTATHLINGALRTILGPHVWQAGAYKGVEGARLDVTHWSALSPEQLSRVERLVNRVVAEDRPVLSFFEPRGRAEERWGFGLYQGGAVPGRELRIVEIEGFDVEACGGTHCTHTSEVGFVKILGSERIQDGMVRVNFVSGERSLTVMQEHERILQEASRSLAAPVEGVPPAVERLKERVRLLEKASRTGGKANLKDVAQRLQREGGFDLEAPGGSVHGIVGRLTLSREEVQEVARELTRTPATVALLASEPPGGVGLLFIASSWPERFPAQELLRSALPRWGGRGGGNASAATASGPPGEPLTSAVHAAREALEHLAQRA